MTTERLELDVTGMTCAACAVAIETSLMDIPGVEKVVVNVPAGKALVHYDPTRANPSKIVETVREIGYGAEIELSKEEALDREMKERRAEIRRQIINNLIAWPLAILVMLGSYRTNWTLSAFVTEQLADPYVLFALTTIVMIGPARQFFVGTWRGMSHGFTDMNLLLATGTGAAYGISVVITFFPGFGLSSMPYYETAAMLTAFIVLGRLLEALTRGRASEAIRKLMKLQPQKAIVLREGKEVELPVEKIVKGDVLIVKPGESVPVDGEVIDGYTAIDESMITGESIPVEKRAGDEVIGGTMNRTGSIRFRATKVGKETALAQIVRTVEEAQTSKPQIQRYADVVAGNFILAVHAVALLAFVFWFFFGFDAFYKGIGPSSALLFSILVSVAVLVISCPCAVGLATPSAIMVGTGKAAEYGILFKGGEGLERASKVDTAVFDKTGTITKGEPEVTDTVPFDGSSEEEILTIAASAEQGSEHPLGEAIIKAARSRNIELSKVEGFEALPGLGIRGSIDSRKVLIGNKELMEKEGIEVAQSASLIDGLTKDGKTVTYVALDGRALGAVAVADTIKDGSKEAIAELKEMGIECVMLTGDNKRTAEAIARQVGIEKVISEVVPQQKAEVVRKLQNEGKIVAMAGDGINDAPALAQADVGIAMGAGTDVAKETGHIVLIRNDLCDVVVSIDLARRTMSKIRSNLFWALVYNTVGIPVAAGLLYGLAGFLISPELAGAFMAMSSISVTLNALTLKGYVPEIKRRRK